MLARSSITKTNRGTIRASVSRQLLLLVGALELKPRHAIDRDTIHAVIILSESFRLVIIVIGSAAATWAAESTVEQAFIGIDSREIIGSFFDRSGRIGDQMVPDVRKSSLHVFWAVVAVGWRRNL